MFLERHIKYGVQQSIRFIEGPGGRDYYNAAVVLERKILDKIEGL
jgi:hypothetical protein